MRRFGFRVGTKWVWILSGVAVIVALLIAIPFLTQGEALRRFVEKQLNERLKGYTAHVQRAKFNLIAFSVSLGNVDIIQNANPDPPVARIQGMQARLHWRSLLRGHIVGEFLVDRPKVFINLASFRAERQSGVPIQDKGWQEAVQVLYPIKINEFRIVDGELTYKDQGPYKPLSISRLQMRASNIRNIISLEDAYPSSVHRVLKRI